MPEVPKNGERSGQASLCKRCGEQSATYVIRQEDLCQDCFVRYVKTKVIKRMEAFRGRPSDPKKRPKLLLPLSLGVSSTALLHILDGHSQGQVNRTGQANYELQCVHVLDSEDLESESLAVKNIQGKYPRHAHSVKSLISVTDVIAAGNTDFPDGLSVEDHGIHRDLLQKIMSSPSSRSDLMSIARTKTVVEAARGLECDGILWGDTTTRLAEKVLAETAKGRGSSLPWIVNDGQNTDGISFFYPLKDVLKKEVVQFAQCQNLPLEVSPNLSPTPVKNNTIDSLMTEYFQSVEENYPSIVANVVRTSSKLLPLASNTSVKACAVCDMATDTTTSNLDAIENCPAEQDLGARQKQKSQPCCYGCDRLMRGENLGG